MTVADERNSMVASWDCSSTLDHLVKIERSDNSNGPWRAVLGQSFGTDGLVPSPCASLFKTGGPGRNCKYATDGAVTTSSKESECLRRQWQCNALHSMIVRTCATVVHVY